MSKKMRSKAPVKEEGGEMDDQDPDDDEIETFRDPPEGGVHLRPSIASPHIPATIFVEYPPELKMRRLDAGHVEELGERKMGYKSHWERICVRNAFVRAGFKKSSKYWTGLWSKHQNSAQLSELNCLQKVNHFPASWCIGRKDRLSRTLNVMKRIHGNEAFDFHPDTYIMPGDLDIYTRILKAELASGNFSGSSKSMKGNSEGLWIMKPVASSCGRGISVVTSSQALAMLTSASTKKKAAAAKTMLFQKYLINPLLINKKKFDLRIYVLVTGVDPLRIYIHREGLTRISTSNFTLKNIKNRFAHLTNYSVNKKNAVFKAASYEPTANHGDSNNSKSQSTAVPRNVEIVAGEENEDDDEENDNNDEDDDGETTQPTTDPMSTSSAGGKEDPEVEGYKWSLQAFKTWLSRKYSPQIMQETFQRIFDIIVKTMIAMEGEVTPQIQRSGVNYRTNCFELFGCDVILDEHLQPQLLEVNVSPSLMGSSPLDKRIKGMLIADVLHTVGFYTYDPVLLKKYDGVRTEEDKSPIFNQGSSGVSAKKASNTASTANISSNPFAFSNLSRLMHSQEAYRRNPCSSTIDLDALSNSANSTSSSTGSSSGTDSGGNNIAGNSSSWWQILLLIEDEMHRARSGGFIQVHPVLPAGRAAQQAATRGGPSDLLADLSSPVPAIGEYYLSLYRNARFHDHLLYKWLSLGGCRGAAGQRYLPKYLSNVIRNNLELNAHIYGGLNDVGQASFHVDAGNNQGNSSMGRPRSKSLSRPQSATSTNRTVTKTEVATTATGSMASRRPSSGFVSSLHSQASPRETTGRRLSAAQTGSSDAGTMSSRPTSRARARSRSFHPASTSSVTEGNEGTESGKQHNHSRKLSTIAMETITALANEYYTNMSLQQQQQQQSSPVEIPQRIPSIRIPVVQEAPALHSLSETNSPQFVPRQGTNPNVNRNSSNMGRPLSAQRSSGGLRGSLLASGGTMGLDGTDESAHELFQTVSLPPGRKRSISAPHGAHRSSSGKLTHTDTGGSDSPKYATSPSNQHQQNQVPLPINTEEDDALGDRPVGYHHDRSVQVLDILRQRRVERQALKQSQLQQYEAQLALLQRQQIPTSATAAMMKSLSAHQQQPPPNFSVAALSGSQARHSVYNNGQQKLNQAQQASSSASHRQQVSIAERGRR